MEGLDSTHRRGFVHKCTQKESFARYSWKKEQVVDFSKEMTTVYRCLAYMRARKVKACIDKHDFWVTACNVLYITVVPRIQTPTLANVVLYRQSPPAWY